VCRLSDTGCLRVNKPNHDSNEGGIKDRLQKKNEKKNGSNLNYELNTKKRVWLEDSFGKLKRHCSKLFGSDSARGMRVDRLMLHSHIRELLMSSEKTLKRRRQEEGSGSSTY